MTENHQEENARGLEASGAAEVLVEQGWDLPKAVARVEALVADPARLLAMSQAARIDVVNFDISRPTLEDVFLSHTNKELLP